MKHNIIQLIPSQITDEQGKFTYTKETLVKGVEIPTPHTGGNVQVADKIYIVQAVLIKTDGHHQIFVHPLCDANQYEFMGQGKPTKKGMVIA